MLERVANSEPFYERLIPFLRSTVSTSRRLQTSRPGNQGLVISIRRDGSRSQRQYVHPQIAVDILPDGSRYKPADDEENQSRLPQRRSGTLEPRKFPIGVRCMATTWCRPFTMPQATSSNSARAASTPCCTGWRRSKLLSSRRSSVAGRNRIVYRVTKQGQKKLESSRATWQEVVAAVNTVLQGGTHGQAAMA